MVAKFIFAGLAVAELSYCEPCTDETLDGIAWTSGVLANNYEYDGTTRRNDDYKVLVKQTCATGFTGTATRICDGNGAWLNPDVSGCTSDPCQDAPLDFEDYKNIDNGQMKTNCPSGSAGGFECDVACKDGFFPVVSKMMCYGGQWSTSGIACVPKEQNSNVATTTVVPVTTSQGSASTQKTSSLENDNASAQSNIGPIVAVCVALAILLVGAYVAYSVKKSKANNSEDMSNAGSNRSHQRYSGSASGSRRGRSRQ